MIDTLHSFFFSFPGKVSKGGVGLLSLISLLSSIFSVDPATTDCKNLPVSHLPRFTASKIY